MDLVTIVLLFCVHLADAAQCDGVKNKVKFCSANDALKIAKPNGGDVAWRFKTKTNPVPSESGWEETTDLKGPLKAPNTGVYFATYGQTVDKYTIIVDAVNCPGGDDNVCNVPTGESIKLVSGANEAVTWMFQGKNGAEAEVTVGDDDPPKFTEDKKELGLFDIGKAQSGTYKAMVGNSAVKTIQVEVRTPVDSAKVKKKNGCDLTLVCNVVGDAKEIKWHKASLELSHNPPKTQIENNVLTISALEETDKGNYICKATEYGGGTVDSPEFTYAYAAPTAVSKVSIRQSDKVLTCEAQGDVRSYQWLRDGESVTPSDGAAGKDRSKFTLAPQAKGKFVCKATGCDETLVSSEPFPVTATAKGGETNEKPADEGTHDAAIQGLSCSVALLVLSVFVGLYVMML
ncbi:neural cell adhesion molecule 1-A-like [Syngnathus typhle]